MRIEHHKIKPFNSPKDNFIIVFILCFAIITCLLFHEAAAKVIRQVHPPPPKVLPQPPDQYLQRAHFCKWDSKDIIKTFKDRGLEAVDLEDGLVIPPPGATESTMFLIPSYGKDIGGVAAGYDSEGKLEDAITYYSMMNQEGRAPAWRIYRKDNILLLLSGSVPEEKAREYEKALNEMGKKL